MKLVYSGVLMCLLLVGCGHKNIDTLDSVKQGVIKDIGKNVNIAAMDVNVVSVAFRDKDKEADAVVSFAPRGGTAQQGLTMQYTLERKDDEWHIKSRAQSDLQKHAAQAGPGGMSSAPGEQPQALPPGHPSTNGGSGTAQPLPPGHPPLNGTSQK